jgi:hypothetical protein
MLHPACWHAEEPGLRAEVSRARAPCVYPCF